MGRFSKESGRIGLILEMVVSIGIVIFLFWYFYLKPQPPVADLPNNDRSALENYQEIIDSAKFAKCLSEAKDQQDKDDCSK